MIELPLKPHPQPLHHAPRPGVPHSRKRQNLPQTQIPEPVRKNRPSPLRSYFPAQNSESRHLQPLAYARGSERLLITRVFIPSRDRKGAALYTRKQILRRKVAKLARGPNAAQNGHGTRNHRVALFAIQNRRKKLHHPGVGVHARKRFRIPVAPLPQNQSLRLNHQVRSAPDRSPA